MGRTCIFCDESLTGNRSEEHCIPRWLIEHLGLRDDQILLGVAQTANNEILESRHQPVGNFVEGRVCGTCNNGWMNRLENEARPILKSLVDGKIPIFNTTPEEKLKIGRWAAKTAYAVSHASPLQKLPLPSHLRFMKDNNGEIPPRVGVFAQLSNTPPDVVILQQNHWGHFTSSEVRQSPPLASYKTAMKFRQLVLLVAYWPEEFTGFVIATGVHIPLAPVRPDHYAYVPDEPLNMENPNIVVEFFSRSLAVADIPH
jgi:hypothetical protein